MTNEAEGQTKGCPIWSIDKLIALIDEMKDDPQAIDYALRLAELVDKLLTEIYQRENAFVTHLNGLVESVETNSPVRFKPGVKNWLARLTSGYDQFAAVVAGKKGG